MTTNLTTKALSRTLTAAAASGALVVAGAGAAHAGGDHHGDRSGHGHRHHHGDRSVVVKIDGLDRQDKRFVAKLAKKAAADGVVTADETAAASDAIEDRTGDEVDDLAITVKAKTKDAGKVSSSTSSHDGVRYKVKVTGSVS